MAIPWTVIKQSDNRKICQFSKTSGITEGFCPNKTVRFGAPVQFQNSNYRSGKITAFLGHKTKNFVPNKFRITPAVHSSSMIDCSDTSVELLSDLCYPSTKTWVVEKVSGPIALLPNIPGPGNLWDYPSYSYDVDESLVHLAMARSNEAQAAVLTTAVELPETLGLFIKPLSNLGNALKGLSNPRTLKRISKNVKMKKSSRYGESLGYAADAWLTLRYGILPAISEVETYRELFNSKLRTPLGPIVKARSGGGEPRYVKTRFDAVSSMIGLYFWGERSITDYVEKSVCVYSQRQWDIQSSLGLDLSGVLQAGWEKVPYSFVLDWFINFGDWLQAIVPVSGVTQLGMSVSTAHIIEQVTKVWSMALSKKGYRTPVSSVARNRRVTYRRWTDHVPSLLPAASPYLGNVVRMIDSVSLAFNRARNKLPYR